MTCFVVGGPMKTVWSPEGFLLLLPYLEPFEGFSFERPSGPNLEPYKEFPLLLRSPLWSATESSPNLKPYEEFSFRRSGGPHLKP